MRILFIYKYEYMEPIVIMYLSSFLKKHGHDCDFIDLKFENNIIKEVQKVSPDIIAYSITTGKHRFYQKLNQELKRKFKFFSVFGGAHCTFFPEFIYEKGVDAICIGEGEFPLLELADSLEKGKDITKIKNLWIKIKGKIYKNEVRKLIEDLDILPFPDRELIHKYNHYKKLHRRFIVTGRGCPYNCTFCFNHSYHKTYKNKGKIVRKRSINNVIEELKFLKRTYHPKRFQFLDDTFIIDRKWTLDFCKSYKKGVNIPFIACTRVNLVDEEIVKALKEAGCITTQFGIESGNDYIRNDVLKKGISEKQIIDVNNLFNKYGIKTISLNMFGLPDETLDMAFETLYLNIKCKPSYSMATLYQPYPRTQLCGYSKKKGYFDGDLDSIDEVYYYKSVMKTKDIKKIVRLQHLFAWAVAFPALMPVIKIMINLPFDRFYRFLWDFRRAWCYLFHIGMIDLPELL